MTYSTSNTLRVQTSLIAIAALLSPAFAYAETQAETADEGSQNISRADIVYVSIPVIQGQHQGDFAPSAIAATTATPAPAHHTPASASASAHRDGQMANSTAQGNAKPKAESKLAPASAPIAASSQSVQANETAAHVSALYQGEQISSSSAASQGQVANQDAAPAARNAQQLDASGDAHQIRFRADSLVLNPVLNVALVDRVRTAQIGEQAHFQTFNNYPSFIERGEIRIFLAGKSPDSDPLVVLPVDANGAAFWEVPQDAPQALFYTFRVIGKTGQFDETVPKELTIVSAHLDDNMEFGAKPSYPEFGISDEAARRTIELEGLMASVRGFADPERDHVMISGQSVPVDLDGKFASQQIISRVDGAMDVTINRDGQEIKRVSQSFSAPRDDWFIVGQGDLTLGKSYSNGPASIVSGDTLAEGSYALGRAAFYAKGVVNDDIKITASLDTGETLVEDLFSNLDRKDPRQLLRRLNGQQYYPTYGDDSTLIEDAPTQGRFYLRAQKDASQFVIGNFTTQVNGSELAQLDRGLFGALADFKTKETTSFGERKGEVIAFASDPGTIPGREEFRGTGGSLYFLKRQDVSIGSERVRVEVRDRETGLVLESNELNPQQDYDFDPFQGRLTLLKPLASTASSGSTVRESSSSGNIPVLVVRYEYSPAVGDLSGYTLGARTSAWLGDKIRLGATAQRDTVDIADQTMLGADALLRLNAGTYVKAEIAQTDGPGFGQSNSVDGGLTFTDIANPGTSQTARAWRSEVAVDLAQIMHRQGDMGRFSAYYEHQDAGFSSAGRLTPTETQRWGAAAAMPIGNSGNVTAKYDELFSADAGRSKTGVLDIAKRFNTQGGTMTTKAGLRYEDRAPGLLYNSHQDGSRTDGAIELGFSPRSQNWEVSAFGQATLDHDSTRSKNNRVGAALKAELSERLSLGGEVSEGDGGFGADVQLNHRLADGSEAYVGYAVFADRSDTGGASQNLFTRSNRGTLTIGARQRFSDSLSVYGENRIGIGGSAPSYSRSMGLRFDPTERLSVTGSLENGKVDDANTGVFRRTAASLAVGYSAENVRAGTSIEMRNDQSAEISGNDIDQTVWLWRNNLSYEVSPDWRFMGEYNIARADNNSPSVRAAEFTEAAAGFAWRPVDNERINALLRLQYFEDLGPVGQITGSGQTQAPKQVSTIFTADVNYDLTKRLTIGGKYGYRQGSVSLGRNSETFVSSDAHLGVIRADYNIAKKWDILTEGRALWVDQADDMRLGALGAVYRHINNNVKIGAGYSLSDFSDDLTDQSYTSHGPFINLIGKF